MTAEQINQRIMQASGKEINQVPCRAYQETPETVKWELKQKTIDVFYRGFPKDRIPKELEKISLKLSDLIEIASPARHESPASPVALEPTEDEDLHPKIQAKIEKIKEGVVNSIKNCKLTYLQLVSTFATEKQKLIQSIVNKHNAALENEKELFDNKQFSHQIYRLTHDHALTEKACKQNPENSTFRSESIRLKKELEAIRKEFETETCRLDALAVKTRIDTRKATAQIEKLTFTPDLKDFYSLSKQVEGNDSLVNSLCNFEFAHEAVLNKITRAIEEFNKLNFDCQSMNEIKIFCTLENYPKLPENLTFEILEYCINERNKIEKEKHREKSAKRLNALLNLTKYQ